ncbi:TPR-like protein [Agrocybe pediades]|nr:TPR-like protein [Agrocybe pediades]
MNLSYLSAGIKVLAVIGEKSGFSWVSGPAGIALEIVRIVESAQTNKEACRAVAIRVFRTLHAIHQPASPNIEQLVRELQRELRKALDTVRVLSAKNKFSQALQADDIKKQTAECVEALDQCIALFFVKAHFAHAADSAVLKSGIDDVKTIVQSLKIEDNTVAVSLANLNISSTAPPPPAIFVGRDDLLAEGTDHLIAAPGARLAILGQGGIGKTSLSLAILHHASVKNAFADKRYFLSCESLRNGVDLTQAILHTLDVSILSQKLDLKTILVQQLESLGKSLFLFDNFETLSNDSSSLIILETISSIPSISLFINMRGEFPPPSISWFLLLPARGLRPLSLTAAKALYLQRQHTSADPDVPNPPLDSLLTEVDCVPLAVFILSELGKRYPIEVLQQRWIQSKTRLLKLPGAASSRLTSVAISLDMSMNSTMLKDHPEAVRLLHLLAFLPEGLPNWSTLFPLITSSFEDSYDALDTLCQTSLVQRTDHVISMLNPTRQYLNSSADSHREAVESHLDVVFKFIIDSVRENSDTLSLLGKANIADLFSVYLDSHTQAEHVQEGLLCADYLYDHDMLTTALIDSVINKAKALGSSDILAKAFEHKGKILFSLSDWKDSVEAYCAAYALYQQLGYKSEMAQCLISLGNSYVTQDDHARSAESYSEAYTIYTELEDQSGAAISLIQLGEAYRMQNKYAEAEEAHVKASTIFKAIDNQKGLADSLKAHADDLYTQHEYSKAYSILEEAVGIYTEIEDQLGLANAMTSMGNVLKMQSKFKEAIANYQHAYEYFKRMNKFLVEASCLRSIGDILGLQGNYAQALKKYDDAYKIFARAKYQSGMALCLDSKGYALIVVNEYSEAMEALQAARHIFSSIGGKLDLANSLNNIGTCYKMQEQYDKAVETHEDAYKLHKSIHNKVGMAKSLHSLGDVLRLQRKFSEAFIKSEASLDIYTEIGDERGRAGSLLLVGNQLLRQNDSASAIENFKLASSIYQALGSVHGMADTFNFLGDAYRMSNNAQESLKMYTDARALYQQLGHRQGEANSLKSLGDILRVQQKHDEALESHKEALKIYESLGENLGKANCLSSLADDLISSTKYSEAKEKLETAYRIFKKLEEPLGMANSKLSLGKIFNKQGNVTEASKCFDEALAISEKIQYKHGMANALYSLGHNFSKDGNYDQAIQKYDAAYKGFEENGNKFGIANTLKALRDVLRLKGEHGQAKEKDEAAYLVYKELLEGAGKEIVDSAGNDRIRQNLLGQ